MSVTVIWSGLNRTETESAAATQAAPCACQQAREVVALIESKRSNLIQAGVFVFLSEAAPSDKHLQSEYIHLMLYECISRLQQSFFLMFTSRIIELSADNLKS